jgi:hypothetical protein
MRSRRAVHVVSKSFGILPPVPVATELGRSLEYPRCMPGQEVFRAALEDLAEREAQEAQAAPTDGSHTGHTGHIGHEGNPDDALWFTLDPLPDVRELAERYGDPTGPPGDQVHFYAQSLRYRWLDLAEQAARHATQTTTVPSA